MIALFILALLPAAVKSECSSDELAPGTVNCKEFIFKKQLQQLLHGSNPVKKVQFFDPSYRKCSHKKLVLLTKSLESVFTSSQDFCPCFCTSDNVTTNCHSRPSICHLPAQSTGAPLTTISLPAFTPTTTSHNLLPASTSHVPIFSQSISSSNPAIFHFPGPNLVSTFGSTEFHHTSTTQVFSPNAPPDHLQTKAVTDFSTSSQPNPRKTLCRLEQWTSWGNCVHHSACGPYPGRQTRFRYVDRNVLACGDVDMFQTRDCGEIRLCGTETESPVHTYPSQSTNNPPLTTTPNTATVTIINKKKKVFGAKILEAVGYVILSVLGLVTTGGLIYIFMACACSKDRCECCAQLGVIPRGNRHRFNQNAAIPRSVSGTALSEISKASTDHTISMSVGSSANPLLSTITSV